MERMTEQEMLRAISHCFKCRLCSIADFHGSGEKWLELCPSGSYYGFNSFYSPGRLELLREILTGEINEKTEMLMKVAFGCQVCGACYERCKEVSKVELDNAKLFEELRAILADKGWILEAHTKIKEHIDETNNAYGVSEKVEYSTTGSDVIYFVGCTARYREEDISKSMIKVLDASGVGYTVLADEWCCGSTLLRTGQVSAIERLVTHNVEKIKKIGAKTMVFTCPGCLKTFKETYPDMGIELLHASEYINMLIDEGRLNPKNLNTSMPYHDPCHLGRHLGIYDAPRETLKRIGVKIEELPRNRANAWCCGSGGGVKSGFPDFAKWTADERVSEIRKTGFDVVASACPFCKRNLQDSGMKVFDLAELVSQSLL
ncbi:MAG: Lactate utilization protein A [Candidatus Argoarchaeum ethanivorans]|uniref:Lactate utilization protein A n=1 Tax=Candidatus Argoarchaeum ethanivorans TaxID=2608793 RepID=A0A811TGY7_9EURY|nr:MAG: Lactate utilization protein A [Candidatus Argoarchaeum ethanivorans]